MFSASSFSSTLLEESINHAREVGKNSPVEHELNLSKEAEAQREIYSRRVLSKISRALRINQPVGNVNVLAKNTLLKFKVSIGSDGELQDIEIIESSGSEKLDLAIVQTIRVAAPFSRFPVPMANELKKIEIIRDAAYGD